ncbi:MAG TPA: ABC transporter permease [Blastocatellia bacterium]|jgi:putative ABC transport system permease protein|nr:ABC transporter permease [Blastocatellia bacterium]
MRTFWQDLRFGARMLLKKPGFTIVAVITLAMGIGANTAVFSLINAVLLRPLPFYEPERLVMVWEEASFAGFPQQEPAPANYIDWKARQSVFEDMAAMAFSTFRLTGDGEPQQIFANSVTANFFPVLGIAPALGRTFSPEEEKSGANKVVVLSYKFWQTRYGGERDIIGREILLDDEKYSVIGVMPAEFQFMNSYIALYVPMAHGQEMWADRRSHDLNVVARMKRGVGLQQARADIQTITQRIALQHPHESFDGRLGSVTLPLHEQLAGESGRQLIVLLAAVGLVLLIACANIAGLLLARAAGRRREIAVRAALGAGRGRIVRQLLTESLLLAFAGGLAGLLLASWSFAFLEKLIPVGMALSTSLTIDRHVLGYTLLVALLTGVIFGLAPALQASKVDLNEVLKEGGQTSSAAGGGRLRGAMVVFEIAMAMALLVCAGLLIQTFHKLSGQYSFLQPEKILTMRTRLPRDKYKEMWQRKNFYDQTLARVKTLPGVISAGYTTTFPLQWKGGTSAFRPEGGQLISGSSYDALYRQVTADYLQSMSIPLRQGRYFDETDNERSMPSAIINETMARQYWPDGNALGKRFRLGGSDSNAKQWPQWITVVGVVADIRQMGIDAPVKAEMYLPYQQDKSHWWMSPFMLAIRVSGDPMNLVAAVSREIHAVDPNQPISVIATMAKLLGEETEQRQVAMILLATFAGIALLLAALGIYGVLAYFVAQRTREIGVRVALGARSHDVMKMVMKQGMTLTLFGTGLGLISGLALARLMKSLLFGVSATDPLTFAAVATLLAIVAMLACYIPARRATKVDPVVALRCE